MLTKILINFIVIFFVFEVVLCDDSSEGTLKKCVQTMNLTSDPHPIKTLVDKKLLYPFGFGSMSGYKDSTYSIIVDEAKKRNESLEISDFDVKKYTYNHASDASSVVNTMLLNICGASTKWPSSVRKFEFFKDGRVYDCNTSVIETWRDKVVDFLWPKCTIVREDLRK